MHTSVAHTCHNIYSPNLFTYIGSKSGDEKSFLDCYYWRILFRIMPLPCFSMVVIGDDVFGHKRFGLNTYNILSALLVLLIMNRSLSNTSGENSGNVGCTLGIISIFILIIFFYISFFD